MGDRHQHHQHKPLYQSECIKDPSDGDTTTVAVKRAGFGGGRGSSESWRHDAAAASSYQHQSRRTHHHTVRHSVTSYSSCEEEEISIGEEEQRKHSSSCTITKKKKEKKKNISSCKANNSQDEEEDGVMVTCERKKNTKKNTSTNPKKKKGSRCECYDDDDDDEDDNNSKDEEEKEDDCGGRPKTVKEIKFFSHPHPLILDIKKEEKQLKMCHVCSLVIVEGKYFYRCEDCPLAIHKTCSDLPRKIRHEMYPGVTFGLTDEYIQFNFCNACDTTYYSGLWYRCSYRNIMLDVVCAGLPLSIFCDPKHCRYRLQLCYDFPYQAPGDRNKDICCGICMGSVRKNIWSYYNEATRFIAHPICVLHYSYPGDFGIAMNQRLDDLSL